MADAGATPGVEATAPGEQGERALHVALKHLAAMPERAFASTADAGTLQIQKHMGEPLRWLHRCLAAGSAQARAVARLATVSRAFRDAAEGALPAPARAARSKKYVQVVGMLAAAGLAGIHKCETVHRAVSALSDAPAADHARCAELARASREALRSRRCLANEALIEARAWLRDASDDEPDTAEAVRRWRSECFVAALEGTWDAHES
jgi:hypothetical protein